MWEESKPYNYYNEVIPKWLTLSIINQYSHYTVNLSKYLVHVYSSYSIDLSVYTMQVLVI